MPVQIKDLTSPDSGERQYKSRTSKRRFGPNLVCTSRRYTASYECGDTTDDANGHCQIKSSIASMCTTDPRILAGASTNQGPEKGDLILFRYTASYECGDTTDDANGHGTHVASVAVGSVEQDTENLLRNLLHKLSPCVVNVVKMIRILFFLV